MKSWTPLCAVFLTLIAVQSAPRNTALPTMSPKVRAIYDHIVKSVPNPLQTSGVPHSSMAVSGSIVSDVIAYGDTPAHCLNMFHPNFVDTKEELLISTMTFDKKFGGPCASNALYELNRRNQGKNKKIRVYFLISTLSEMSSPRLLDVVRAVSDSIPTKFGMPDPSKLPNLDFRVKTYHYWPIGVLHHKLFIRDGNTFVAGSKNWESLPGMELTIKLQGTVAATARQDFIQMWGESIRDVSTLAKKPAPEEVPILYLPRTANPFPTHPEDNAQDQGWIKAMDVATKSVFIMSPNFIAQTIVDKVLEAVKRGVKVTVITAFSFHDVASYLNTKSAGNNKSTIRKMYTELLKDKAATDNLEMCYFMGKRVQPPKPVATEFAHIKFMAVDDEFIIFGSGNQDTQSWYNSSEVNILVDSPKDTKHIVNKLKQKQNSLQYCYRDWNGEKLATDPTWMEEPSVDEDIWDTLGPI
jgi:hypothetical protein